MIKFDDISFRTGVPSYINVHVKKLFEGNRRQRGKNIIIEHLLTGSDRAAIRRIIEYVNVSEWAKLARIAPSEALQIIFFDAAWIATIDYNQFRYRRGQAGETLKSELSARRQKIEDKVNELRKLIDDHNRIVGGPAFRAHLGTPMLNDALNGLLWEIENYDSRQIYTEDFVCEAVAGREKSPKREYLRAFLAILKKNDFPIGEKGVESLIVAVSGIACSENITRYDVRDIIREATG